MVQRKTTEQVAAMDAEDDRTHPARESPSHAYFTLAGAAALNSQLVRKASNLGVPDGGRSCWELCCPQCKSFLGYWICPHGDAKLSPNQQRKNRNTTLLGKSHYNRFHEGGSEATSDSDDTGPSMPAQLPPAKQKSAQKRKVVDAPGKSTAKKAKVTQESEPGLSESEEHDSGSEVQSDEDSDSSSEVDVIDRGQFKAANEGDATAQFQMGRAIIEGGGCKRTLVKAVEWYQKAAEQGHIEAQCALGDAYWTGQGCTKSTVMALEWYRKAAGQGHARSQYHLGVRSMQIAYRMHDE